MLLCPLGAILLWVKRFSANLQKFSLNFLNSKTRKAPQQCGALICQRTPVFVSPGTKSSHIVEKQQLFQLQFVRFSALFHHPDFSLQSIVSDCTLCLQVTPSWTLPAVVSTPKYESSGVTAAGIPGTCRGMANYIASWCDVRRSQRKEAGI